MRAAILLPLALAAVAAAGCGTGSAGTEEAAMGVPARDLTLQEAPAPAVEVASAVELAAAHDPRPTSRAATPQAWRERRPAAAPSPAPVSIPERPGDVSATAAPDILSHSATAAPRAITAEPEPDDPHALAPGKTVTIIPASTGPSTDQGWTDQRPAARGRGITLSPGGHGGGCRPRGIGAFR